MVLAANAARPTATLLSPVVVAVRAFTPTAVLFAPVVAKFNAA